MKIVTSTLLSTFPNVISAFTTREGGVSRTPYSSANLAFHVGDNPMDVIANHDILASLVGYNRHSLIHMRQIHSDTIVIVDENIRFDTPPECDALITDKPNIPLMVMSADCTPILLYDPNKQVIGVVHAGRAGALNKILVKTIQKMINTYDSTHKDIHIILGPSIHGCCYEINEAIAIECEVQGYTSALRKEDKKLFLDVNTILLEQLKALKIENFEVIDHCTSCQNNTYFSYRADKKVTGRIAGVIMLR
ncbi:MAG: peptidoglycan editing factor PgeF [Sulfuricurvum sp.]|uniref:peptidoglycan editing factor PgeF n=1 Tax=Sulfuricurvum sp. TaxID=2025608 RepID=UPI002615DD2A|nr:peptidoglycan editing factor PgeF [Sulfuricurvum sp.]MDD2829743.1 peptidoglycan editing factor PgeF [Sulfuricurvum sp.]MDD4948505.1 peptidoglycan editing factor PgeF [Sulfuricurvum sp.]